MNLVDQVLAIDPFSPWEDYSNRLWDPAFVGPLEQLTRTVPDLSSDDLARVLTYANTHRCYYHTELCDLLDEAVKEAVKRLQKLQQLEVAPRDGYMRLSEYRELERTAAILQSRVRQLEAELDTVISLGEALDRERAAHAETRAELAYWKGAHCAMCGHGPDHMTTKADLCTPAERKVLNAMESILSSHLRDWISDAESNYTRAPDGLIRNVRIRSSVEAFKAELARRGETL